MRLDIVSLISNSLGIRIVTIVLRQVPYVPNFSLKQNKQNKQNISSFSLYVGELFL